MERNVRIAHGAVLCVAIITSICNLIVWMSAADVGAAGTVVSCNATSSPQESARYAPNRDLFGSHLPLITVSCGAASTTVTIGTGSQSQYVYKDAYEWVNGAWKKLPLTGTVSGVWIVGKATASLDTVGANQNGKIIAYICQNVGGVWKCGCKDAACSARAWHMQEFTSLPGGSSADADQVAAMTKLFDSTYLPVYGFTSRVLKPGESRSITGINFSAPIVAHFGDTATTSVRVTSSTTAVFTVPKLSPGIYTSWFTAGEKRSRNIILMVFSTTPTPVVITSVTPAVLRSGSTVTIQGSGFTPTGNLVYVGAFTFKNLTSSDGKTVTFTLKPQKPTKDDIPQEARMYLTKAMIDGILTLEKIPSGGEEYPMEIQMFNGNGSSNAVTIKFK